MAASTSEPTTVLLAGGVSVLTSVWRRLLELEGRGVVFHLLADEHFECEPAALVTAEDVAFLRAYRAEAHRILTYEAPLPCH